MVNYWTIILIFVGMVSFVLLIITYALFFRIIWLQLRIFMLAKRGFHLVEHIGEDRVRRYFYLRPNGDKFDFNNGYYIFIPDSSTKMSELMIKPNRRLTENQFINDVELAKRVNPKEKEKYIKDCKAEYQKYCKIYDALTNLKYSVDAVTLRWGIPTITYYGNQADPIKFQKKQKTYDAKILKDLYLRILLTQKFKEFQKWIKIAALSLLIIGILMFIYVLLLSDSIGSVNSCLELVNQTQIAFQNCQAKLITNISTGGII